MKALGATGTGLLAGCVGLGGNSDGDSGPITIGALQPFSGPFAIYSKSHQAGLEYAVGEVNDDGGVLGRDLDVNDVDTKADAGEAASTYTRLVQDEGIVAATGPVSSDVGITVAQEAEDEEVPLFLHASGSHKVLTKESQYTFRVGLLPAPTTMRAAAGLVEEKGFSSVGAVIADYAWGHAIKQSIEQFFPDGTDITFGTAPLRESDFTPYLRDFSEDVELIVGTGHPPGIVGIFKQLQELSHDPEMYLGSTAPPEAYHGALGETVTNGFTCFHQADVYSSAFTDLAQQYYDDTGEYMGPTQALGYVTGKLMATGIEEAGSADPTEVADAVRNVKLDSVYANPIEYTEWGELKNQVQLWSQFELEAPSYYPDGEFDLVETYRSESLEALDPSEFAVE